MVKSLSDFERNITYTRKQFFDEQNHDVKVGELVRHSWKRCLAKGLGHKEKLVFTPINKSDLLHLQDQEHQLIECFNLAIKRYQQLIKDTNYLVVLTNFSGIALTVQGELKQHNRDTRHTFRPGICFSEEAIGTNAMGCAIHFGKEVSIFGGEHFMESINGFQCAAAPILDQHGHVIATVDLSRCTDKPDYGAKHIAMNIARDVEIKLFLRQEGFLKLELKLNNILSKSPNIFTQILLLNFDADGILLSSCHQTRQWLELGRVSAPIHFEDIFEHTFGAYLSVQNSSPNTLKLNSGLEVNVQRHCNKPVIQTVSQTSQALLPEFGDPSILRLLSLGLIAMDENLPILISGETGTGKDVLATCLYEQSHLNGRFIALNCASIPESLIESELFGYEDGAFTGARKGGSRGKIEQADNGVLFLDEIGDMPLALQARLLRVIETGEVIRLGSERTRISHFRLLAASHIDLQQAVQRGEFREDLYYRIKCLNLHLPPLRQRTQLPRLVQLLVEQVLGEFNLTEAAMNTFCTYRWPGNVRELVNALKLLKVLCRGKTVIDQEDLPKELFTEASNLNSQGSLPEIEQNLIISTLSKHKGHVPSVIDELKISRATLYRKIQNLGLQIEDFRN